MEEIPLADAQEGEFRSSRMRSIGSCCTSICRLWPAGRAFEEPVYSFADYARTAQTRRIEPSEFIIVEGLFVLYWPELRGMLDTKVYVETDPAVCFERRLAARRRGARPHAGIGAGAVRADGPSERRVVCDPDDEVRGPGGLGRRAAGAFDDAGYERAATGEDGRGLSRALVLADELVDAA